MRINKATIRVILAELERELDFSPLAEDDAGARVLLDGEEIGRVVPVGRFQQFVRSRRDRTPGTVITPA